MAKWHLLKNDLKEYDDNLKLLINSPWNSYAMEIWKMADLKKRQLTQDALTILNKAKNEKIAKYIVEIFKNKELLKNNLAITSAQKLIEAKTNQTAY